MNDRFYQTCQRCGDQAGAWSHLIAATGRLICGKCWRELEWDAHGHKIDDLVVPVSQHDETSGYPHVDKSVHKSV